MPTIKFDFTNTLVSQQEFNHLKERLTPEITRLQQVIVQGGYDDERASINLLDDNALLEQVLNLAQKHQDIEMLVVVGIGGSNLGTMAVEQAILGQYHNLLSSPKVFYADTVDCKKLQTMMELLEKAILQNKKILINVISKSGSTTETIANFEILLALLEKHHVDLKNSIVVTTDADSKLDHYARAQNFVVLTVPTKVGGRYSIFSAVGLFPLAVLGIDVKALVSGARTMRDLCLKLDQDNPAAQSAIALFNAYKNQINIHDTFIFATDLENIGKWYRQLMAESLGKEHDRENKVIHAGMTPTVSIGSTDLHSMVQLYLGGPKDKFTTFINVANLKSIHLPEKQEFESIVSNIQGLDLANIMQAIYQGTKLAYQKDNLPFIEISLSQIDENVIGQLLQMKMIEIIYLGYLMNVNQFDQPAVEKYKVQTKQILSSIYGQ